MASRQRERPGLDRGPLRRPRDGGIQPRPRRSAREGRDQLSRRARRRAGPDGDDQLRKGAAAVRRSQRGVLGEEPPRALPREAWVEGRRALLTAGGEDMKRAIIGFAVIAL